MFELLEGTVRKLTWRSSQRSISDSASWGRAEEDARAPNARISTSKFYNPVHHTHQQYAFHQAPGPFIDSGIRGLLASPSMATHTSHHEKVALAQSTLLLKLVQVSGRHVS